MKPLPGEEAQFQTWQRLFLYMVFETAFFPVCIFSLEANKKRALAIDQCKQFSQHYLDKCGPCLAAIRDLITIKNNGSLARCRSLLSMRGIA